MITEHHLTNTRGMIYRKTTGHYTVHTSTNIVECTLSPRMRRETAHLARHVDPLTVGDVVEIEAQPDGSGWITMLLPRENWLARPTAAPMPGAHTFEQVIVANVDLVIPVFAAAQPVPHWGLLDRYLVASAAQDLPALICITKLDMAREADGRLDGELEESVALYRRIGYPVILTSAQTGEGLAELNAALSGRISVLVGKSGVGKSSLLNALQPELGLRVKAVIQSTGKGRHTTAHLEMFSLDNGGALVDTPGVREFGLWGVPADELDSLFPEMRPYLGQCRFGLGCQHNEEPGCAVRRAVVNGDISPYRYQSYLKLKMEA